MRSSRTLSNCKRYKINNGYSIWRSLLIKIIRQKHVTSVFQPITNIFSGKIIGYEAFSRGSSKSPLISPDKLFCAAREANMLLDLEQVCVDEVFDKFGFPGSEYLLFLNINAETMGHPSFQNSVTNSKLLWRGYKPGQLVFEISLDKAIPDFNAFRLSLNHYRRQGFLLAIDHAGTGFASLQAIAELNPDYIKLDMSIIRGIHLSQSKQAVVEAMVKLAAALKAKIIAEGVECPKELAALYELGINYVQGHFLASPASPAPQISEAAKHQISRLPNMDKLYKSAHVMMPGVKIGEIAEFCPTVHKALPVRKVKQIIDEKRLDGIVVVENDQPIGLVMKNDIYYRLGTSYGVSLYLNRPTELIMDRSPLIVSSGLYLEDVSQIAMNREERNLYDLIIVVEKGRYMGVVSIMDLLNHVTQLQISCAHNCNPLTGLYGNLVIESKLKSLLETNKIFTIFYIDLDNFKAFNDKYGFERGDQAILMTAQILKNSLTEKGSSEDFIGHIGGDDFILITSPEVEKDISTYIIENFDKSIVDLYEPEDLRKGFIEVNNRHGRKEEFPVMSISIAGIRNINRQFQNHLEIGEVAAELKKLAKACKGSAIVYDKRIS